jgi:ATP-dependent RNA helicase SUPV3L1/SUV3
MKSEAMNSVNRAAITAVLGPTNTGKTHLAVERLCAHSSGIMGFPLRLLAREVYDRVVAIKGADQVGLITGEEKILPPNARWLLCTAESMPVERDVAFVALDEAQLGVDEERGHIFTDRLSRARGREETMILGSESLRPMVRALLPEAEIITRPRFSKLSYAGTKKLSRLPPRSAIVAFSADQVYAVAEMLRRARGGAAVVMGALSPRTRNAQVAMYQAGEVDYLVATDAIGMGLNMDVSHVAFASLSKFDGKRQRRLSISEIAQIAGRAGRHQRDGTFGTLGGPDAPEFSDEDIERIENHRFPNIKRMMWRNAHLDYRSVDHLITSLEILPDKDVLKAAPEALDVAVLKRIASDFDIKGERQIRRLWDVCQLPDFRKLGPEPHSRLVSQVFAQISNGLGHIDKDWIARELARLDTIQGDVDTIAGRLSHVRTWAYIAHRPDWLADPAEWTDRARALEEKLSDALHTKLTERFVDRRTSMLMKSVGVDPGLLDVEVDGEGHVTVEGQAIGTLTGFQFFTDPGARLGEKRALLAAAEHYLVRELDRRAAALSDAADVAFTLNTQAGATVTARWQDVIVGTFAPGKTLTSPRFIPDPSIARLEAHQRKRVIDRLDRWFTGLISARLKPLLRFYEASQDPKTPPELRALYAQLFAKGGLLPRQEVEAILRTLKAEDRKALRKMGVVIGTLDLYHLLLLKPEAVRLSAALVAIRDGVAMPPLPMPGLVVLHDVTAEQAIAAEQAGFRRFGRQMLRIDLVERIAKAAHDARGEDSVFTTDPQIAASFGLKPDTLGRIYRALGFFPMGGEVPDRWHWRGRPRHQPTQKQPTGAFAALSAWRG